METGEIIVYFSIYNVAKRFNQQSGLIFGGNVYRNRYAIKILTESESF